MAQVLPLLTPIVLWQLHSTVLVLDNDYYASLLSAQNFSVIVFSLYAGSFNSNVTTKFVQIHHFIIFYHKMLGGDKRFCVPPCPKLEGTCTPVLLNAVPGYENSDNVFQSC